MGKNKVMEFIPQGVRYEGLRLQRREKRCLAPPRGGCLHGQFCLLMLGILPGYRAFAGGAEVHLNWDT